MDVAYQKFHVDAIKILQDIAESHFVAFDLEFSGISGGSLQRTLGKPSLQELYDDSRAAATKYQILQVGLAMVKEDVQKGQYIVKPYNFNISPLPILRERQFNRDWSMNSGAIQFLLRNGFDFSRPFTHGIPYLSRTEEAQARLKLSGEYDRKLPDMKLKAEDDNLVKHIRKSVDKWQNQPIEDREDYLNIPNDDRGKGVPGVLNRYQMRLTHQVVQNEFPNLQTTSMREFIQITNPSQEERDYQKQVQQENIEREIGKAIGFRWILEALAGRSISGMPDDFFLAAESQFPLQGKQEGRSAFQAIEDELNQKLSKRRKILIGHNCFTDLIFLHRFYTGHLPETVEEFQKSIHDLFPAIVDTKHIASHGNGRWSDTSLTAVEDDLRVESEPDVVVPPEFDRYAWDEKPHEAGYDALLTAKIAVKLSAKMEREAAYYDQEADKSKTCSTTGTHAFGTQLVPDASLSVDTEESAAVDVKVTAADTDSVHASTTGLIADTILEANRATKHSIPTTQDTTSSVTAAQPTLVAIKENKSRTKSAAAIIAKFQSTAEVEKLRNTVTTTANIYEVLNQKTDTTSNGNHLHSPADLITFSDSSASVSQSASRVVSGASGPQGNISIEKNNIEQLVKEGRLMPRWDGGNGFWTLFGNKLQVNSSKEGVFDLT